MTGIGWVVGGPWLLPRCSHGGASLEKGQLEVVVTPSGGCPGLRADVPCVPKPELGRHGSCEEGSPTGTGVA